jgi:hypothetical protein
MAQIKCGNCGEYHGSAVEVMNCYRVNKYGQAPLAAGENIAVTADDRSDYMNGPSIERVTVNKRVESGEALRVKDDDVTAAAALDAMAGLANKEGGEPLWPASDAQIKYVLGLQDERRLPDDWTIRDEATLRTMEKDEVSSLITMLKAFPRGDSKQHQWSMPPGRYALNEPQHGEWRFYQIDKPTIGRWAGYTFIKRLIGAPGDYKKVDMSQGERNRVLAIIENVPRQASIAYGKQAGICGICSSPLTNAESLAAGIGPKCRSKVGW